MFSPRVASVPLVLPALPVERQAPRVSVPVPPDNRAKVLLRVLPRAAKRAKAPHNKVSVPRASPALLRNQASRARLAKRVRQVSRVRSGRRAHRRPGLAKPLDSRGNALVSGTPASK